MSRRNSRERKARRRAGRERQRRSATSGEGPRAVEVQAVQGVQAFLRPAGSGPRNADENGSVLPADADGGLIGLELDEAGPEADADLENADPGDFDGLDADDAGLQVALTGLAVLGDDISDVAEMADDLVGDADGLEVPGGPDDLEDPEAGQPSAEADGEAEGTNAAVARVAEVSPQEGGEDEEIFVVGGDDDDDLPAARVAVAGATADPVKDYLKQIDKGPLLNP